jgi:hypothetical protein
MSSLDTLPRFQFSLKWLLIAVAICAVLLAFAGVPAGQGLVGLFLSLVVRGVIPTAAVIGAIYGRGELQAFAIGAVVASVPILTAEIGPVLFSQLVVGLIWQVFVVVICGSMAVISRRWLERRSGK